MEHVIGRPKLYHTPMTRSARCKWLLHEIFDDNFDLEVLDLYRGEQYEPSFLAKNPRHAVPVLEIEFSGGSTVFITESSAIVMFLGDLPEAKRFAPSPGSTKERALYLQMMSFAGSSADMMLWQIRLHEHLLPASKASPLFADRYRKKFAVEVEPHLARALEERNYAAGNSFSAADCMVGHVVIWAQVYGLCRHSIFDRYVDRLSKRPAYQKAFSDASAFVWLMPDKDIMDIPYLG